ncbi:MAG TPA: phosphoribosylaminoimidazolesuccinocarboxamide synthase [Candidatus Megaira endosymbiont of Hartmannula sinica]|nr:phosphoribosylaminoimidazolesuccinocarboxamide synthase [Candidatus Megaera endosymbiont of Hartmannula sinica]
MNYNIRKKLYQGKRKDIFTTSKEEELSMLFSDRYYIAKENNKFEKIIIPGKGSINNNVSCYFMEKLNMIGISNHFIKKINMREQIIQYTETIPIQFHVSTIAHDRYVNEFSIEEWFVFDQHIIDYKVKNSKLNYPIINEQQMLGFDWIIDEEIDDIKKIINNITNFLTGFFLSLNIRLVSLKLEFGRIFNGENFETILIDEISLDNLQLWDIKDNKKLSYELIQCNNISSNIDINEKYDYSKIIDAYKILADRIIN